MAISTSNERTRLIEDEECEQGISQTNSRTSTAADVSDSTPLNWSPLLVLLVVNMMQPLTFEIVFPFVNQMILEVGVATDPERVGYYSGFIESLYSCMSFIAILPCSALADRIGRKPVVLSGMLGLAISVACFGMSKSFIAMVLSRGIGGTLGAAWACTRTMIGEMTDKSNQGMAFSASNIAYRTGQVIGLPLGGLLSHPERNFSMFRTPFWYEYPFALPCFVAAALSLSSVIMGYFLVQETLGSKRGHSSTEETTYGAVVTPTDTESTPPSLIKVHNSQVHTVEHTFMQKYKSVMTSSTISLFISNIAMCFSFETTFAVLPLFSFTPVASGGLGMSEAVIGIQMGIRALLTIVVSAFFSPLQRRLGTVRVYQYAMWAWPLTILCFPLLHLLARQFGTDRWPFTIGYSIFLLMWSLGGLAWPAASIIITDNAPSAAALALMNGVSQMAIILPQAIAPAFTTSLFAASVKSGIAGGNLVWIILFLMTAAAAMHSMTLREPDTDWRKN